MAAVPALWVRMLEETPLVRSVEGLIGLGRSLVGVRRLGRLLEAAGPERRQEQARLEWGAPSRLLIWSSGAAMQILTLTQVATGWRPALRRLLQAQLRLGQLPTLNRCGCRRTA